MLLVMEACAQNGLAVQFASAELLADGDLIREAMKQDSQGTNNACFNY